MVKRIRTDLTDSPYFDDYFDESNDQGLNVQDKQYVRILFKPATAVQARELTQLQTMLQRQIAVNGSYFFRDGSVVLGCDVNYYPGLDFVRCVNTPNEENTSFEDIKTNHVLAVDVAGNNFANNETIIRAVPIIVSPGSSEEYPNTNIIYLRYISGALNEGEDVEQFPSESTIRVYNENQDPTGNLDQNNLLFNINMISETQTETSKGVSYAVNVGDGVIFQKGHFLKVNEQTVPVKKHDRNVDGYVVGFNTEESIITADQDSSLFSNALGYPNENAPGADRLKLTPTLVSKQKSDIEEFRNFFPVVEFSGFQPYQVNKGEESLRRIRNLMAERTREESGDYSVKPFDIEPVPFSVGLPQATANNENELFVYDISPGTVYVRGYRVETLNSFKLVSRKATDTKVQQEKRLTATIGNYFIVNELFGFFDFEQLKEVTFYDTALQSVSEIRGSGIDPTSPPISATEIGTAKIRSLVYFSGTKGTPEAQYLMYVFDIKMNSNKTISEIRSINIQNEGCADIVLESSGVAKLYEPENNRLFFSTGYQSVKSLKINGDSETNFIYYDIIPNVSSFNSTSKTAEFAITDPSGAAGSATISGINTGDVISGISTSNFTFSFRQAARTEKAGEVTTDSANTQQVVSSLLLDSGFDFTDSFIEFVYPDTSTEVKRVVSYDENTNAIILNEELQNPLDQTVDFNLYYPEGFVIDLVKTGGTITAETEKTIIVDTNLAPGIDFDGNVNIAAQIPVQVTRTSEIKKKINKNQYIGINTTSLGNPTYKNTIVDLGITDVCKIKGIFVGENYSENNPDRTSWFIFDNGQRDGSYERATLRAKKRYWNQIKNKKILVKLDWFENISSSGVGYYSVDSYPVDDNDPEAADKIATADIPFYTTEFDGRKINLKNVIDFRPKRNHIVGIEPSENISNVQNNEITQPYFQTLNVNPGYQIQDQNARYIVYPNTSIEFDLENYLPRIDYICLNWKGNFSVVEGAPAENPIEPEAPENLALIAVSYVPPYPTLTKREEVEYGSQGIRSTVSVSKRLIKRYTMRDIAALEERIKRIEYYTTLNLLEQQAKDLIILDENGNDRFKNGIFADSFRSHLLGRVSDFEYNIAIDERNGIARSKFSELNVEYEVEPQVNENVQITGNYVTLPYTDVAIINQPNATKVRNLAKTSYTWNGSIRLFPESDFFKDTERTPVRNVTLDLSSPWEEFFNENNTIYGEWRTIKRENETETLLGEIETSKDRNVEIDTQQQQFITTTTETQQRTNTNYELETTTNKQTIGNFVKDVSTIPFMRSREVIFVAYGLKPNTRHYAFFNEVPVSEHCARAQINQDFNLNDLNLDPTTDQIQNVVRRSSNFNQPLRSDNNGTLIGIFRIPEGEFLNGERDFLLSNIEDLTVGRDAQISSAFATYNAYGLAVTKQRSTVTTHEPNVSSFTETEERTIENETIDYDTIITNIRDNTPTVTRIVNNVDGFDGGAGQANDPIDPSDGGIGGGWT